MNTGGCLLYFNHYCSLRIYLLANFYLSIDFDVILYLIHICLDYSSCIVKTFSDFNLESLTVILDLGSLLNSWKLDLNSRTELAKRYTQAKFQKITNKSQKLSKTN